MTKNPIEYIVERQPALVLLNAAFIWIVTENGRGLFEEALKIRVKLDSGKFLVG